MKFAAKLWRWSAVFSSRDLTPDFPTDFLIKAVPFKWRSWSFQKWRNLCRVKNLMSYSHSQVAIRPLTNLFFLRSNLSVNVENFSLKSGVIQRLSYYKFRDSRTSWVIALQMRWQVLEQSLLLPTYCRAQGFPLSVGARGYVQDFWTLLGSIG